MPTQITFTANTLIKSADVNTNFTNINSAIPWATNPIAAKGDLLAGTGANVASRLAVGANGKFLTADSTQTTGIKWADAPTAVTYSGEFTQGGLATSVAASALTINLTQPDGSTDPSVATPVLISFRDATLTSGAYNTRTVSSSLSLTVPSGATLGTANAVAAYLWVYALDNAGTVELAICGMKLDEGTVHTSTTISSSADSNSTLYSSTGRSNKPIKLLGRLLSTQTIAGTWDAAPSEVSVVPDIDPTQLITSKVYLSSGGGNISGTTNSIIPFDTVAYDSVNAWTTGASAKFTAPVTGYYRVTLNVTLTATGGSFSVWVNGSNTINGVTHTYLCTITAAVGNECSSGSAEIYLSAGDYVQFINVTNGTTIVGGDTSVTVTKL